MWRMAGNALVPVKIGRPSDFSNELALTICERLASGELLIDICEDADMPHEATVRRWVMRDVGGFSAMYADARRMQIEHEMEMIQRISDRQTLAHERTVKDTDDGVEITVKTADALGHRRLQVDTRKWRIARIGWRWYGVKPGGEEAGDAADAEDKVVIEGGLPEE